MKRLLMLLLPLLCLPLLAGAEADDYLFGHPDFTAAAPMVAAPTPAPTQTAEPTPSFTPEPEETYLIISAAGDVTIGRDTRKTSDIFGAELARQGDDLSFPFRNVQEFFLYDDLTLVNFEGTLTNTKSATNNTFSFASPPEHVAVLPLGFIEAVALENNHMMDHGEQGLLDTQEALRAAGIVFSGFGEVGVYEAKGFKIGMLSYQTFDGRYPSIHKNMPGAIQALREDGCDLVIVSYHWGAERDYVPNENQQKLGRATIDAGADLVLGHHSHCLQPIERYNGKYIVYSLGNFSFAGNIRPADFDTMIFQQRYRVTPEGRLAEAGIRVIPCSVSSQSSVNDFIPTPYDEENAARVVKKMMEHGRKLPYHLVNYPLDWASPASVFQLQEIEPE